MKQLIAIAAAITVIAACSPTKETMQELKAPTLTLKWETDTVLTTCESVLYDKAKDVLYVANIMGKPDSVDGVGSIGKVGLDGKVIDATPSTESGLPMMLATYNTSLALS